MIRQLVRTMLLLSVICSLVTTPTLAQNDPVGPTQGNLAHSFFIPLVAKTDPPVTPPEWHPNFIRFDAAAVSAAEAQDMQQVCADPLTPASTAVSAQVLQQCLLSGIYSTVQSDSRMIFLGETPHIALGTGSSPYTFRKVSMITGGGYTAGSNQLITQDGTTIYWMDVSALPADQLRDLEVGAADASVIDGGALYMKALEKVLTTANELRKITISPDRPIYNLADAGSKTPRSCGMNGALVEVSLSYLGHRYSNPPAVRIETYDHVLASSIGKDRQVWPHESYCMLASSNDAFSAYRYIKLDDLRNEPSYAAIDAKVKEELKKMNFYLPKFSWRGVAPTLPENAQWAMTAQETGKNLVYFLIGYYMYKTGAFQPQHMYIIGTNACVEQFLQYGICKVTPKNE